MVWRGVGPAGGPAAERDLEPLLSELTGRLAAETVDGVLLALDGADRAAGEPDVTGPLLARVRDGLARVRVVVMLDIACQRDPAHDREHRCADRPPYPPGTDRVQHRRPGGAGLWRTCLRSERGPRSTPSSCP